MCDVEERAVVKAAISARVSSAHMSGNAILRSLTRSLIFHRLETVNTYDHTSKIFRGLLISDGFQVSNYSISSRRPFNEQKSREAEVCRLT